MQIYKFIRLDCAISYQDGLLRSVINTNGEAYIQNMDYDEYDASVLVQYGNDMVNTVAYDEVHRRPVYRQLGNDYSYPLQQIYYDYDGVGNIVRLSQEASPYNNYGGEYQVSYTYDEQYRLWEAWQDNSNLGDYSYTMHYSPSGLVGTKVCPELDADIVFGYDYDGEMPLTHQPKMIHAPSYYEDMTLLSWDAAGQLTYAVQSYQDRFRRHWWNEAGQLSAAISNEYCGYYGYNAQGERAYKLTGTVTTDQYNAGEVGINTYFDDIVLYVNPYMVVTPRGYTKHYYNGSQRIAARLGDYWAASMADESDMVARVREVLEQTMNSSDIEEEHFEERYVRSIDGEEFYLEPFTLYTHYMTCSYSEDMLYEALNGGARLADHIEGIDRGIFYYHPDHLGSSSWITDDRGQAVQYLHYMPFGELWENQQASEYDERFKFTGKERDTETGYDYFGARYYSPMIGHWLSPDPLSNKYPNISPYAYCSWNPIKNVDPDGRDWYAATDETGTQSVLWRNSHESTLDVGGTTYSNIGENYTFSVGNTSYSYSQNDLQAISYGTNTSFYAQGENKTGCKKVCEEMVKSSGTIPEIGRAGEILMAIHDENGVVTAPSQNVPLGLNRIEDYITNGSPCIVGVDYKSKQIYNTTQQGGDGMTDHFITIVGMRIDVLSGKVSYQFYDPGSQYKGQSPNNMIMLSNGLLRGKTAAFGNPFTVTTIRRNK